MEHESQRPEGNGEEQEVRSAAPEDESRVVGENADVPAGEGEEADEAGVEGGSKSEPADGAKQDPAEARGEDEHDDRDALARQIEADPASNPDDPALRQIKGG